MGAFMQINTETDITRLLIELHRIRSAFASFRQASAYQLKDMSDALSECQQELQRKRNEIISLKERMTNEHMKPELPTKRPETLAGLRQLQNINTSADYPLIAENANLKHQIAQLQAENLRLKLELNRLNGGPSPFQCQPNSISSPQYVSTLPIASIETHQPYIKG